MNSGREVSVSALIARLALRIKADFGRAFQECGVKITSEQWGVLRCLWQEEGISQSVLAEKLDKDKASITRILDIMENNQLLSRCDDRQDRRSYRIFLTDAGRELEGRLRPVARETNRRITRSLSDQELGELQRLLLKLVGDGGQ